jgi:hypothetical protein
MDMIYGRNSTRLQPVGDGATVMRDVHLPSRVKHMERIAGQNCNWCFAVMTNPTVLDQSWALFFFSLNYFPTPCTGSIIAGIANVVLYFFHAASRALAPCH